jgi:type III restriction enzyme
MLVLEIKGQQGQQDGIKRDFLREWVEAVNTHSGFGKWASDVSFSPAHLPSLLAKHS